MHFICTHIVIHSKSNPLRCIPSTPFRDALRSGNALSLLICDAHLTLVTYYSHVHKYGISELRFQSGFPAATHCCITFCDNRLAKH